MWCMCYFLPPDDTVGRTAQTGPHETVVVGADHCHTCSATQEGAREGAVPLMTEQPSSGPAPPPAPQNAQARAREQQRWIWVV